MTTRLSNHFSTEEFSCHDGTDPPPEVLPNLRRLVTDLLEPIRESWGGPLVVISGYRTPEWNTRVGGAPKSTHLTGEGADIRPLNPAAVELLYRHVLGRWEKGELPALGGFGSYRGWIHLDTRKAKDGHVRRWGGRGWGSELV